LRFSYSPSVCYDELAAEWPFIAAVRTLIVGTKGRIVIGFAVTQGAPRCSSAFLGHKLK
jgi:hypothetical protein